jgi:hypothetical protein
MTTEDIYTQLLMSGYAQEFIHDLRRLGIRPPTLMRRDEDDD